METIAELGILKRVNIKKWFNILVFVFLSSGCDNPLGSGKSKIDPNYGNGKTVPAATKTDLISGSVQGVTTQANRRVDISVGAPTSALKLTTSAKRTVFLSVQGQIISR